MPAGRWTPATYHDVGLGLARISARVRRAFADRFKPRGGASPFARRGCWPPSTRIQAHGLHVGEQDERSDRVEPEDAGALLQQVLDARLGLRRIDGNGAMGAHLAVANQLDLRVAQDAVVPPAKMMSRLEPRRAAVVDDGESRLVDVAGLVEGAKDALRSPWLERRLTDSHEGIDPERQAHEPDQEKGQRAKDAPHATPLEPSDRPLPPTACDSLRGRARTKMPRRRPAARRAARHRCSTHERRRP